MHDILSTVWVILILIGVVSSVINGIRKMVKTAQTTVARPDMQPRVPVHEQSFQPGPPPAMPADLPPLAAPPIVITRRQPKPADVKGAAESRQEISRADRGGTRAWRGMFERENLARAFVAAQVFGPPKALQEQSLWSPRSSEPSI